jgi:predicted nucleic acid-binding Zn ribbon protein
MMEDRPWTIVCAQCERAVHGSALTLVYFNGCIEDTPFCSSNCASDHMQNNHPLIKSMWFLKVNKPFPDCWLQRTCIMCGSAIKWDEKSREDICTICNHREKQ